MSRVKSKSLFNFRLRGEIDDDILAAEEAMVNNTRGKTKSYHDFNKLPISDFVNVMRTRMNVSLDAKAKHPVFSSGLESCDHSTLMVPTNHSGEYLVKSLVHSPLSLIGQANKPAIIYAHGGGVVGGTVDQYKPYLSSLADECGVVVFNVDYRLAPETSCPNNILDFYHTLKHIVENADDLSIDPARIAIAGESGGGYIVTGTMIILAQQDESHLVKLAIPNIPMLSDYSFSDKASMTSEERESADTMKIMWKCIAGGEDNLERMKNDPLLFPDKATDEILTKMPPTILWEAEFDVFITEATRFARRLRAAGRLLEFVVMPGMKHASGFDPSFWCYWLEKESYRLAVQEYLIK